MTAARRPTLLVLGVGSIGERHVRCFQATGRCDMAIAEVNGDLRQRVAERYGVARAYADLDAALQHPPAAAVIATPAPLHIPMALRLAQAGVHLLIEKPLGTRLDQIDELQAAVHRSGITAGVAYVYRCHPLLAAMRQALQSGRFGRPVQLVAVCGQHFPTYRPAYREIYYTDHSLGGGAIQDALTHVVNAGEWLLGPIDRLVADASHQVLPGVTVEDTVHVLARHGDALASYSLNQHQAPNEMTLTVNCERGTVCGEFHAHRWRWMAEPGGAWHDEPIGPLERDTLYIAQANTFLDAIERREPCPCSLAEGIDTLRANLAALASWRQGTWQKVHDTRT